MKTTAISIKILTTAILFICSLASAAGFVSLSKAKTWLTSNNRCVFSAVRTYRGTESNKGTLAILGAKADDVERFSYPNRTPALCIFEGSIGKGAAAESGCIIGWYMLDQDQYESFKYTRNSRSAIALIQGKCDAAKVKKYLLEYKFNDTVAVGPYLSDKDVWLNYNEGFRGKLEADIHIINDEFGVKAELDRAVAAHLEKQKAEKAKRQESEQKKVEAEKAERLADEAKELDIKKKNTAQKKKELQAQIKRDEARAKIEVLRKPCLSECDNKFKTNKEKLPCLQECNHKYLGI